MAAVTLTFTPAVENLSFTGSRPSRTDAILLGMEFYNASTVVEENVLIEQFGAILVRRSLRAFANYAKRTAQPEVAKAAEEMRDSIVLERGAVDDEDDVAV